MYGVHHNYHHHSEINNQETIVIIRRANLMDYRVCVSNIDYII